MKAALVLLCAIFASALAQLPEREMMMLKATHDACQAHRSTHVDRNLMRNLSQNIDNKSVGAHALCMTKTIGLQKANGDLDLDVIRSKIYLVTADKSKVDGFVKKCGVFNINPEKTAALLYLCFRQNDIPYYHHHL